MTGDKSLREKFSNNAARFQENLIGHRRSALSLSLSFSLNDDITISIPEVKLPESDFGSLIFSNFPSVTLLRHVCCDY